MQYYRLPVQNPPTMNYKKHIVIDPLVRFGKPSIKGTRITVSDVLCWLAAGMSIEEIIEDYPTLTKEHIYACLAYSADKERRITTTV
jgi:uncharacterized protein (DUF433 family)